MMLANQKAEKDIVGSVWIYMEHQGGGEFCVWISDDIDHGFWVVGV